MLQNFKQDKEIATAAEAFALLELEKQYGDRFSSFQWVGSNPEYYYKGDIKAIDNATGEVVFFEIKNDSRIHETQNILCEEEVYYKDNDYLGKGNMSADGDYYCIISFAAKKIYILDYKKLKQIYKKGEYKVINHPAQTTYCYLLELCRASQWGALLDIINF